MESERKVRAFVNPLYYGDNLEILRDEKRIPSQSVDLCYIDPPFNSDEDYNQIYSTPKRKDTAQSQAFLDTWTWDTAAKLGFAEIISNESGRFESATIQLFRGLRAVLKETGAFAYLISMTLRIIEIRRALKLTGSFYLHCDPTASHYLKLVCDSIFGIDNYLNEIIWRRTGAHNKANRFGPIHDSIHFYRVSKLYRHRRVFRPYNLGHIDGYFRKSDERGRYWTNSVHGAGIRFKESGKAWNGYDPTSRGRHWAIPSELVEQLGIDPDLSPHKKLDALNDFGVLDLPGVESGSLPTYRQYLDGSPGMLLQDIWAYQPHTRGVLYNSKEAIDEDVRWPPKQGGSERLGYQTQKPEGLMERIIRSSSDEGQVVLDAYCGCGTTVAVAEKLNRRWIGIDITYQSISLVLKRLEDSFGADVLTSISLDGIPRDIDSAAALANRKDDRTRKEFEKWAVLTYSNNRAVIHNKKGADGGIDGTAFFYTAKDLTASAVFQVKSGSVQRSDIAKLNSDRQREGAELGIFLTLQEPTQPMRDEAVKTGTYNNVMMGRNMNRIQIVTIQEVVGGKRMDLPMSAEVLKSAPKAFTDKQDPLF